MRCTAPYGLILTHILLQALLCFWVAFADTTGFLSIDCGSDAPSVDVNGIQWVPDEGTMNVGEAIRIGDHADQRMSTMRVFRGNESKYCYTLSNDAVKKGAFFLVRASFWPGSTPIYTPQSADGVFHFKQAIDGDEWRDLRFTNYLNDSWVLAEAYVRAQRSSIYYCLARSAPDGDPPFISALELRPLPSTLFATMLINDTDWFLATQARYDYAGTSKTWYPLDPFDRVWFPYTATETVDTISTMTAISTNHDVNMPPSNVLQTAFVGKGVNNSFFTISFKDLDVNKFYFAQFYFAELDPKVTSAKQRMFNIYTNGDLSNTNEPIDIFKKVGAFSSYFMTAGSLPTKDGNLTFNFSATSNSSFPPLLCAAEFFRSSNVTSLSLSSSSDASAIEDIKSSMNLSRYTGDPCIPIQYGYSWLQCTPSLSSASIPRIQAISLSSYGVTGVIPASINTLTMLNTILLDGNNLKGPIPYLGDLTMVVTMNLSNNNLNGSIPESLATMESLKVLHVQNNNLSGIVPAALMERKKAGSLDFEYFGNSQLCVDECKTSVPPTAAPSASTSDLSKAVKTGVIAGVPIVATTLVLFSVFVVWKRRNNSTDNMDTYKISYDQHNIKGPSFPSSNQVIGRLQPKLSLQEFSFDQLKVATSNFTTQIGKGGFGTVFKGEFGDKNISAIKVASSFIIQQEKEFLNEVDILSRVHHKNLVELVGYCNEKVLALVYEFMPNGSLFDCLHAKSANFSPLPWSTRLNILVDAAQGLEYLHNGCSPPIIHRDVKSSNILLNEEMEAKISDFGISRETMVDRTSACSTILMGTPGYVDPEYLATKKMNKRVDVYSFGVVLFEVVCARTPTFLDASQQVLNLVDWAIYSFEKGAIENIVDEALLNNRDLPSVSSVLEVARACVELPSTNRPEMSTVYVALQNAQKFLLSTPAE